MFGSKKKRPQDLWESIGNRLQEILAFPRYTGEGQLPASLKSNNYVLGYLSAMCVNLHVEATNGKIEAEEFGLVLMNSLAIALEMDALALSERLETLMTNPDSDFSKGREDGNVAYAMVANGDVAAYEEFNRRIRGTY